MHLNDKQPICKIISAKISNENDDWNVYVVVKELVVHGFHGLMNSSAVCMVDGKDAKLKYGRIWVSWI